MKVTLITHHQILLNHDYPQLIIHLVLENLITQVQFLWRMYTKIVRYIALIFWFTCASTINVYLDIVSDCSAGPWRTQKYQIE